jgi:hypothetical protein
MVIPDICYRESIPIVVIPVEAGIQVRVSFGWIPANYLRG